MSGGYYIFIADLHLSCDQKAKWQYLISWLDSLRYPVEGLYILGDLFKYWLGDDYRDEMIEQLDAAFKRLSQRMEIILLKGNRDFLLGDGFARGSVRILTDGCVVDLYGKSTVLLHGDRLCRRDWRYRCFRWAADNIVSRSVFTSLPMDWRDWLARSVQNSLPHKSAADVWLDYNWLEQLLSNEQAVQVIYGHLHRIVLRVHDHYREVGLPSWDDKPSWLRYYHDHVVCFLTASNDRNPDEATYVFSQTKYNN